MKTVGEGVAVAGQGETFVTGGEDGGGSEGRPEVEKGLVAVRRPVKGDGV